MVAVSTRHNQSFSSGPRATHSPCAVLKDAPGYTFSQATQLVRIHRGKRIQGRKKEKIPQGWEMHLQDGLNITRTADISSLGATPREHPAGSAPGKPPLLIPHSLLLHSRHAHVSGLQCSRKTHLVRLLVDGSDATGHLTDSDTLSHPVS